MNVPPLPGYLTRRPRKRGSESKEVKATFTLKRTSLGFTMKCCTYIRVNPYFRGKYGLIRPLESRKKTGFDVLDFLEKCIVGERDEIGNMYF